MGIVAEKGVTVSVIIPVHEKPLSILMSVIESTGNGNLPDEKIVVLDRVNQDIRALADNLTPTRSRIIDLTGPPGWRSPCISFNAGLAGVTSDITVINHSDLVQAPGNIACIKTWMTDRPAVYFAKVLESEPEKCMGKGHAGPVLCSSENTRALTFLFAAPTQALRDIGGWDEAFQDGVCYEDDDLTARLWKHGLDFIFDDRFHGEHQSHDRAYFTDLRIAPNMAHMLRKHGTLRVYDRERNQGRLIVESVPGRTVWIHS